MVCIEWAFVTDHWFCSTKHKADSKSLRAEDNQPAAS